MAYSTNQNTKPSPLPDLWGTYVSQGFRVGPSAMAEGIDLPELSNGNRYSPAAIQEAEDRLQGLDQWGPGVYTGGIFTYRILPTAALESLTAAPNATRGQANVVSQFNLTSGLNNTSLPLSGDPIPTTAPFNFASFLCTKNGTSRLVFDYPRCISVTQQIGQTATYSIEVYGEDIYGQKMMESISCGNTVAGTFYAVGNKAFAYVDKVLLTGLTGTVAAGVYVAVGTSNKFGLPFVLNQACHVLAYSQGDVQMQAVNEASYNEVSAFFPINFADIDATEYGDYTPAAGNANPIVRNFDILPYQAGMPYQLYGASTIDATATTKDVRGTVWPQSQFTWGSVTSVQLFGAGFVQDPNTAQWCTATIPFVTMTYYIAGADMYQNQVEAQHAFLQSTYGAPATMWSTLTPRRNTAGIKGVKQYWREPSV